MQTVSRFEAGLLRLLYFFLRREPIERALPLIEARVDAPKELSAGALGLVKDALAKGCTFLLAQRGGWRDERFLRKERPKAGRLWHRTEPADLGLTFSRASLDFLVWITSARPGDKSPVWAPDHDKLTHGDLLLLFFAHEGLRDTSETLGAPLLRKKAPYMEHALCWLAYPEDFTQVPADAGPRFGPWMNGVGSCIVEALQPDLAARWVHVEGGKERMEKPDVMRALGTAQDRVLAAFLSACEKANRRDLARFLLKAAQQLLGRNAHAGMWTGSLQMTGQRLADRAATYQAATALLRHLDRMAAWAKWARSQGRLDDDYAAAQLYLADWEEYGGEVLHGRAQAIGRHLDPMKQSVQP
ncbi:MAG: hypothetical protein ACRC33_02250 [Gemmataceae bacterium]